MADEIDSSYSPTELSVQTESQRYRNEIITHFRQTFDRSVSQEGLKWALNPTYTPTEDPNISYGYEHSFNVHGQEPESSGQLVDLFNNAIYNTVFEGKPPEETGVMKRMTRVVQRTDTYRNYFEDVDVYRMPIVDTPEGPNDYFYLVSQQGDRRLTHPSILTGLIEVENGEKHQAVISTKWNHNEDSGVLNYGYLSRDQILSFIKTTTGQDASGELPAESASSTTGNEQFSAIIDYDSEENSSAHRTIIPPTVEGVVDLPEQGWGRAQEAVLRPLDVLAISEKIEAEINQIDQYKQAEPFVDTNGNESRRFVDKGIHFAILKIAPESVYDQPKIMVFKSHEPLVAKFLGDEGAPNSIDVEDLEQYSSSRESISFFAPGISDSMAATGREGFQPFREGVDREEHRIAKKNKIGVAQEFDKLFAELRSPEQPQ